MFVLHVLHSKDKRHSQDKEDKEIVKIKYREQKKYILLGAWMFVCLLCVLSGRGLCDGLITRPEESYRLWCALVCDLETSRLRRLKLAIGL
jgi:hypothetical protein